MLTFYERYYELSADPFRLSPDHRFCFGHKSYVKARAYLEYALHRGEGFIIITGAPGTGKTTLINEILAQLERTTLHVATLTSSQLEGRDLLEMVAALFKLGHSGESRVSLLLRIEEFLKRSSQKGRRAVLIVDEAQGLSAAAVEELRQLANLQFEHRLLLQVFLLGQEPLRDMLKAPGMEHLRQRIVAASHLQPLNLDEMISYIEHRLWRVGWKGDPAMTEHALRLIHRFSAGVPRRVNLICSRLFLYGSMEHKHTFDEEDARSVIADLRNELLADDEETSGLEQQQAPIVPETEDKQGEAPPVRSLPRQQPQSHVAQHDTRDESNRLGPDAAGAQETNRGHSTPGSRIQDTAGVNATDDQPRRLSDEEPVPVREASPAVQRRSPSDQPRRMSSVGAAVSKAMAQVMDDSPSRGERGNDAQSGGLRSTRETMHRLKAATGQADGLSDAFRGGSRAGAVSKHGVKSGKVWLWIMVFLVGGLALALASHVGGKGPSFGIARHTIESEPVGVR